MQSTDVGGAGCLEAPMLIFVGCLEDDEELSLEALGYTFAKFGEFPRTTTLAK